MQPQNLRAMTRASLLPVVAITLAAGIFVADTIADLEIAVPAFYTVVVLLAVRFCKKAWRHSCRHRLLRIDAAERSFDGGQRLDGNRLHQYDDQSAGDRHHDLPCGQYRIGKSGGL